MASTMEFRKGFRIAAGILLIAAAVISIVLHIWIISMESGYSHTIDVIQIAVNVLLILIGVMILIRKFPFAGIVEILLAILCVPLLIGKFTASGTFEIFAFSSVWSVLLLILTLAANGSIAAGLFLQNRKSQWLLLISGILLLAIPWLQLESRFALLLASGGDIIQAEWSGLAWFLDTLRMIPNTVAWILLGRYFAEQKRYA
ncbi:MAG: hypothetical protein IJI34_00885 [Clostridia bacterium]|nr:hypothetical protein [Clostridia bacterium]